MALKYYLQANHATSDPDDQSARIVYGEIITVERFAKLMEQAGTTYSETENVGILQLIAKIAVFEVSRGNVVKLPFVTIRPAIRGTFKNILDVFTYGVHRVTATFSAGYMLTEMLRTVSVEKQPHHPPTPVLDVYLDINTQTFNNVATTNGIGQIQGLDLKFNPANELEGIYFLNEAGEEFKVTVIAVRTEGKLIFTVPTLAAGIYTIQVRRSYGTKNVTLRVGTLIETIEVA